MQHAVAPGIHKTSAIILAMKMSVLFLKRLLIVLIVSYFPNVLLLSCTVYGIVIYKVSFQYEKKILATYTVNEKFTSNIAAEHPVDSEFRKGNKRALPCHASFV